VERDFSLLLTDSVRFADVTRAVQSLGIAEITSIEAADLFRGKNVPVGKYSLMVRVTLLSKAATLTDAQISEYSAKIVGALEKNLGAVLRAS
jgi:phenylalanyl-tRNA synthetase beta chain